MDVSFDAKLNELGKKLMESYAETKDWRTTAMLFTEYKFVELFERDGAADFITLSGHASLRSDVPGSVFDGERWKVKIFFKWRGGQPDKDLVVFLPYVVAEPVEVSVYHELWDKPRLVRIEPTPIPEADWDRRYGD
jgi:hypothetical protein